MGFKSQPQLLILSRSRILLGLGLRVLQGKPSLGARRCLRPAGHLPVGAIQRSQARASSLIGGLQVKPQPRRSDRNY